MFRFVRWLRSLVKGRPKTRIHHESERSLGDLFRSGVYIPPITEAEFQDLFVAGPNFFEMTLEYPDNEPQLLDDQFRQNRRKK